MCHSTQSLACLWKWNIPIFGSLNLGNLFSALVLDICFPPLFLIAHTDCSGKTVSRCCVQASELFSDLLPFLFPCRYLSLWCHWVDLDIRYMISMWDSFPTNRSHTQSWLVCWISRDENEMHPKSILFSYALECDSKVILEPNFLEVDRTPDLSHLGTRLDLTPIARDEEDKSFLFIIGEIKRCWSKFKHYHCPDYYKYFS